MARRRSSVKRVRRLSGQHLERRNLLAAEISELLIRPLFGNVDTTQYIEFRHEPNAVLADQTRLVVIDDSGLNPGVVLAEFDLSGQQFGENGYLVLLQEGSPFSGTVEDGAAVLQSNATGYNGLPGGIYSETTKIAGRIGSHTFLLAETGGSVLGDDLDVNNDGLLDENLVGGWTVLDSISLHPFVGRGAQAYGDVVFAEIGASEPDINIKPGAELLATEGFGYAGRVGERTGMRLDAWFASTVQDESAIGEPERWAVADNLFGAASTFPFAGRDLDHIGGPNFVGGFYGTVTTGGGTPINEALVFADTNGNGTRDVLSYVVEPDDVFDPARPDDTYPLINAYPGVTITNFALDSFAASAVTSEPESDFPDELDNRIFAKGGISWFTESGVLRFDFYQPIRSASVTAIGWDVAGQDIYGRIDAFDADGNLLDTDQSSVLVDSAREVISVSSDSDNIARIYAYADTETEQAGGGFGSPFGRFDRLEYTQSEIGVFTDETGRYELEHLFPGTYEPVAISGAQSDSGLPVEVVRYEHFDRNLQLGDNIAPVVDAATFEISESAVTGDSVGTVSATDGNGDSITFRIDGDQTRFQINEDSGLITVGENAELNHEVNDQYLLTVIASDRAGAEGSAVITINVTDVNEPPEATGLEVNLPESTAVGTVVGTVVGSDPDQGQSLDFSIEPDSGVEIFEINATNGEVSLTDSLDFETQMRYQFNVVVSDDADPALSTTVQVIVNVEDVNEPPSVDGFEATFSEDTVSGTILGQVTGSDPDSDELFYELGQGAPDGLFFINSRNGFVTLSDSLDFETQERYEFNVDVTEQRDGGGTFSVPVVINVADVNEAPVLESVGFEIAEDAAPLTEVGTVTATDPDANQSLTFAITDGDSAGLFTIEPETGVIRVADGASLDHESADRWDLTVSVADNATPSLAAEAVVTVNVTDVNEPPLLEATTFETPEDAAELTLVGQVIATDPDAGQSLQYTITDGNSDSLFTIDSATGEIRIAQGASLDHESQAQWNLTIGVADDAEPSLDTQATVTIDVTDVNEAPVFSVQPDPIASDAGEPIFLELPDGFISDPEGDDLGLSILLDGAPLPNWLVFNTDTMTLQGLPNSIHIAEMQLTMIASETAEGGLSSEVQVPLEVVAGPTPLHNRLLPQDANADNDVTPIDALRIINFIAREGVDFVADDDSRFDLLVDIDGNNRVTPTDALNVINYLAALQAESEFVALPEGTAEGTLLAWAGSDSLLKTVTEDTEDELSLPVAGSLF